MTFDADRAKQFISRVLDDMAGSEEELETRFPNLRAVYAKVREVKLALAEVNAPQLLAAIESDEGFTAKSRRVRLEQLTHHCKMALRFLDGGMGPQRQILVRAPDMTKLTAVIPELDAVIRERWLEAQKCQHAKAFTAAVIMMGSILEGLLLARCYLTPVEAYRSSKAPKERDGGDRQIHAWTLHALIEVAVDKGWLKIDRGRFSHALRESRNIVHPWEHARSRADFDEETCLTCWQVLTASVKDLIASVA